MTEQRRYRAFLLRLWQVTGDDGKPTWRASSIDARTDEQRGFAELSQLFAFLEVLTTTPPDAASPDKEESV